MNMKKLLLCLTLAVSAASMLHQAQAKMGGGRSFGRQSQSVAHPAPAAAPRPAAQPAPNAAAPAAIPPKPASPWRGIIGGALLGLGVGALMSHFGLGGMMGGMMGSILMIAVLALLAMFIYRLFRSRSTPAPYAGYPTNTQSTQNTTFAPLSVAPAAAVAAVAASDQHEQPAAPWGVPADFDTVGFLRHAKANYIRLQAAWDKADVDDIREFTAPEVYAELKMQIQERGTATDYTDVVTLDAELLGIETSATDYLASVKFSGTIRSAPGAAAEPFKEVWNMAKPVSGASGWVLAGIQQLN